MDCYRDSIPLLKVLCDETRLKVLSMLSTREMSACCIQKAFCCSQPTISYHMKLLVDAGLVLSRKEGCQVLYRAEPHLWPPVEALLATLCRYAKGEEEHAANR